MHEPEIIVTHDGSHSLKAAGMNEHYHSVFGAISESMHVFIEAGLRFAMSSERSRLSILEVGFGTGLNALLTLAETQHKGIAVGYTTLEPFPIPEKIWSGLNYPGLTGEKKAGEWFASLHNCSWGRDVEIEPGFILRKEKCRIQDHIAEHEYNLVYFDAFGPDFQPELWTAEVFNKVYGMTAPGRVLVTYSCKGSVKRAMKAAGFRIEKLPGPMGKREMLRAL